MTKGSNEAAAGRMRLFRPEPFAALGHHSAGVWLSHPSASFRSFKGLSEIVEEEEDEEESERRKEDDERTKLLQSLNVATLNHYYDVLKEGKVRVTDRITINGNTALHLVVGATHSKKILKKMLEMVTDDATLLGLKNSDGSTLLHVAAIVGNTEAAEILVEKNKKLLITKDKEGHTPLERAFSNMHTGTYLCLLNKTPDKNKATIFNGTTTNGVQLLVNAISSKHYHSARQIIKHYTKFRDDSVLMAIAQNFPQKPNIWGQGSFQLIYEISREEEGDMYDDAIHILEEVCKLIKRHTDPISHHSYYNHAILEAARQNAYEVVERIVRHFPNATWSTNKEDHNIIQNAVINRSERVYNLVYQVSEHKNTSITIKDPCRNNLLHLAARMAPPDKLNLISGAALQIQYELQWFKEVKGFVCPSNITQKNSSGDTPQMVFTREHQDLVIKGENWMKATAESYTITAALITTIMFASAITVPGGNNQNTGIPIFNHDTAFTIFAISDAVSLFTSVTSLLMFLSILTTRFAEQDFLFKLPTKLIIGLTTLFISTTAMIVAFGATLFLVFGGSHPWILIPIAALTCLPIASFVTLQFPLIADLVISTYGRKIQSHTCNINIAMKSPHSNLPKTITSRGSLGDFSRKRVDFSFEKRAKIATNWAANVAMRRVAWVMKQR
ncbi:hypothetical protein E3N88_09811 [Mikania micrantha]|uniref:PGG domain-containing protein n=1 Tax=Mikania micrantha TaxID=192012 RepID=A0A5N6PN73_9ASTR|nr:hypothetical protein E3N88_09811 [Mikania micrantha]